MTNAAVDHLRSPHTIRERAHKLLTAAKDDQLQFWTVHLDKLNVAVNLVNEEISTNYPDGSIPYHSRWRHFGEERIKALNEFTSTLSSDEALWTMVEAVITSVLLDAGSGMQWRYKDPYSGELIGRSEGLAYASIDWFLSGGMASDHKTPRADAEGLCNLTSDDLKQAFQVTEDNPLVGLEGRLSLLQRLGQCIRSRPTDFANTQRLGAFANLAIEKETTANAILQAVLTTFAAIWPGRYDLYDENLGDTWKHPLFDNERIGGGYIPFHKLSQWLTYSLVETYERAGISISGVDELTGLPEYRNGGLFFDSGVLRLKDPTAVEQEWNVGDLLIVEWRALTVALLDLIGQKICEQRPALPLVKILQGGTWSAGRLLAAERRDDGGPPLHITSDGTVF